MLYGLFFYLFAFCTVCSALGVIFSRETVKSVFALIVLFLSAAGLFILCSASFLGFVLIIVYVGAVAVFFLFTVMSLSGKMDQSLWPSRTRRYVGLGLSALMGLFLIFGLFSWVDGASFNVGSHLFAERMTLTSMAHHVYVKHFVALQTIALILLVSIVGGIVLLMARKGDTKRTRPKQQIDSASGQQVRLVNIPRGKGLRDV